MSKRSLLNLYWVRMGGYPFCFLGIDKFLNLNYGMFFTFWINDPLEILINRNSVYSGSTLQYNYLD